MNGVPDASAAIGAARGLRLAVRLPGDRAIAHCVRPRLFKAGVP